MRLPLVLKWHRSMGADIEQVILTPREPVSWQAGQFLELLLPGEEGLYFTIANAPARDIELHIETSQPDGGGDRVLAYLQSHEQVMADVGHGDCHIGALPDDQSPVLLLGSATGFSQIKAVAEHYLRQAPVRPLHIYWTARTARGLYMAELAQDWADQHEQVHFSAVISEHQTWHSGQHHMHACICEDIADLSSFSAICCGSPDMVYSTLDYLVAAGLDLDRFHSDMLQFAPRPAAHTAPS